MAEEKKDPKELSYGKQMTSLLIVKDMRSKPKEILKGVAFLAFVCFFLFAALSRGCQNQEQQEELNTGSRTVITRTWSV